MAEATKRQPKTLMGNRATCLSPGDSQPASKGDTPSAIARNGIASQTLASFSTVKAKLKPAPVIAASPSDVMK